MEFIPFSTRLKSAAATDVKSLLADSNGEGPALSETQKPGAAAPIVNLKRDGDKITRIEIKCSCGEVITLDCAY